MIPEPIVHGGPHPTCPVCAVIPTQAPMEKIIAVGFGAAFVSKDGEQVLDGERGTDNGELVTFADTEAVAVADPDHDWRVVLSGPLHGETYQRQGPGKWNCIERNDGFA